MWTGRNCFRIWHLTLTQTFSAYSVLVYATLCIDRPENSASLASLENYSALNMARLTVCATSEKNKYKIFMAIELLFLVISVHFWNQRYFFYLSQVTHVSQTADLMCFYFVLKPPLHPSPSKLVPQLKCVKFHSNRLTQHSTERSTSMITAVTVGNSKSISLFLLKKYSY